MKRLAGKAKRIAVLADPAGKPTGPKPVRGGPAQPQRKGAAKTAGANPAAPERVTGTSLVAAAPRKVARAKSAKPTVYSSSTMIECEIYQYCLYDVGRGLDLKRVRERIPANPDIGIEKRRDTPASISLPRSLVVNLGANVCKNVECFESLSAVGKIYEDGAVTIIVRVNTKRPLATLHDALIQSMELSEGKATIVEYAETCFHTLYETIKPAIKHAEYDRVGAPDREAYTAFCITGGEGLEHPREFLEANKNYLAALLISDKPESNLHPSQVEETLADVFSYHDHDLAVFDLDRCLILDPSRDYEDLLIIAEHSNYQLLELRVLDSLLDKWLDEAEKDMRSAFSRHRRRAGRLGRSLAVKFADIQVLRVDALFILENLENSSKIIGDYFLGKVYAHLCRTFNTDGWKWSVERRLETLQNIYELVKGDVNERTMLVLEIVFISVSVFQVFQMFLMG